MRLLHHTGEPLTEIRDAPKDDGDDLAHSSRMGWKPRGLWVSVEGPDDWWSWCEGEGYRWDRLLLTYVITLRETARILWIKDREALHAFDAQYGTSIADVLLPRAYASAVDWAKVAEDYDGIIIAPYQWEHRLEIMWYYTWDCASGCIWNSRAIERFEFDPSFQPPQAAEPKSEGAP